MSAFLPETEKSNLRNKLDKLVHGMLFFIGALALTGLMFLGLWLWLGQEEGKQQLSPSPGQEQNTIHAQPPQDESASSEEAGPLWSASGAEQEGGITDVPDSLQGPKAGQLVAPPTRDVTPNYQLSPLHQTQPLRRMAGNPLPPPPKQEPLPKIFRQVVVEGPTELELGVGRNRILPVMLAHVSPPDEEQTCWFAGQQASCRALATTALRRFIRRRAVGCDWVTPGGSQGNHAEDETGRQKASCYLGAGLKDRKAGSIPDGLTDVAAWLVRFGWAEPDTGYYEAERQEAMKLERGIHATQNSNGSAEAKARRQEIRSLSATIDEAAGSIAPSSDVDSGLASDGLILMSPSQADREEKKELPLPPGFEWTDERPR